MLRKSIFYILQKKEVRKNVITIKNQLCNNLKETLKVVIKNSNCMNKNFIEKNYFFLSSNVPQKKIFYTWQSEEEYVIF